MMFVDCCSLFEVCWRLVVVSWLLDCCWMLRVVCCVLFVMAVNWLLVVVRCLWLFVCWRMCCVCCLSCVV